MATLSRKVQRFIVTRLAYYERPSEVRDAVKERFDIDVKLPQLSHYDPHTSMGSRLRKDLKELFAEMRKKADNSFDDIPEASRPVRVRRLSQLLNHESMKRNLVFQRDTLIEIEKVMGDVYTDKRKVEHSGEVKGGVLAVPIAVSADDWGQAARQQQSALESRKASTNGAAPHANGNGRPHVNGNGKR